MQNINSFKAMIIKDVIFTDSGFAAMWRLGDIVQISVSEFTGKYVINAKTGVRYVVDASQFFVLD